PMLEPVGATAQRSEAGLPSRPAIRCTPPTNFSDARGMRAASQKLQSPVPPLGLARAVVPSRTDRECDTLVQGWEARVPTNGPAIMMGPDRWDSVLGSVRGYNRPRRQRAHLFQSVARLVGR